MDATQYISMARRWWWLLIVGTVMSVGAYGIAIRIRDVRQGTPAPTYNASATFFVSGNQAPASTAGATTATDGAPDAGSLDRLTQSYASIVTGRGVAERIVQALGLNLSASEVQSRLKVETPTATQLIKVTASGSTAEDAQALIDGVMHSLVALRQEGNLPGTVRTVEVNRAQELSAADSLRGQLQTVVLVAIFGMLGAAAIVVAFEYVTDAVRDRSDAEHAAGGIAVLASIPAWNIGRNAKRALAIVDGSTSAVAERYRMLRTAIGTATEGTQGQVLLVAGGSRGVGTTVTAANVASAFAQAGRRVALVDADMRAPAMARVFGESGGVGLSEALTVESMSIETIMRPTAADGVTLIPAGAAVTNAAELLDSPRFDAVMQTLRQRFDAIVVDSPPALSVTDTTILAAKCDATLIVARGDVTRRGEIAATMEMLRPAAKRIIGMALNADANVPGGGFLGFRVSEPRRRGATVRA